MVKSIKYCLHSEKGFALIAAIIACVILIALGALVVALSTGDIKTSSRVVGDKRAMAAVEKGIHRLSDTFNPFDLPSNAQTTVAADLAADTHSRYEISTPAIPTSGPTSLPMIGYDQTWGMRIYSVDVVGQNTAYNTRVTIGVGVGYGPADLTLVYK